MNGLCRIGINLVTVVALAAGTVTAQGQEQELASEMSDVLLFDTGAALAGELPSAALAEKAGWVKVEKDAAPGQFKGDVVFLNGRIAVVLRERGRGGDLFQFGEGVATPCPARAGEGGEGGAAAGRQDIGERSGCGVRRGRFRRQGRGIARLALWADARSDLR